MIIDDVVEAIFQRLCIRQRYAGTDADRSMSLTELRIVLGIAEAELKEVLWILSFPGDKRIAYPSKDHVVGVLRDGKAAPRHGRSVPRARDRHAAGGKQASVRQVFSDARVMMGCAIAIIVPTHARRTYGHLRPLWLPRSIGSR
jgi:hypothetical protein